MLKPNEQILKKVSKYTKIEAILLLIIIMMMLIFYSDKYHTRNYILGAVFIILILIINHIIIIKNKINLWKNLKRVRFFSWYHFSYNIIVIVSLITASVFIFINNNDFLFSFIFLVFAMIYATDFLFNYFIPLHFIAIDEESILIVNKKIQLLAPDDIKGVYYRNDILIFHLHNDKAIYINFAETQYPAILRHQFSEWLERHHKSSEDIIQALKNIS